MIRERAILAAARRVLRERTGKPRATDTAYNIYLALLTLVIVVFPILRAIVLALPDADFAATNRLGFSFDPYPLIYLAALLFAALGGRWRGAVVPSEQYLEAVVASPLNRALTLRRSYYYCVLLVTFATIGLSSIYLISQASVHTVTISGAFMFLIVAVLFAFLVVFVWIMSQSQLALRSAVVTVAVLLTGAGTLLLTITHWNLARIIGTEFSSTSVLGALALTLSSGLILHLFIAPRVLESFTINSLFAQARKWFVVRTFASTGDVRSASQALKIQPRGARRARWNLGRSVILALVKRDLRGMRRSLSRAITSAVLNLLASFLLTLTLVSASIYGAALAAFVIYFAVGLATDGVRMFGMIYGGSSTYGISALQQALAHSILPTAFSTAWALLGFGAAMTVAEVTVSTLIWVVLVVLSAVALHVFAAFKGPLPLTLLTPIPSPAGDLSALNVMVWLADAILIYVFTSVLLTVLVALTGVSLLLIGVQLAVILLVVMGANFRLRTLSRPAK